MRLLRNKTAKKTWGPVLRLAEHRRSQYRSALLIKQWTVVSYHVPLAHNGAPARHRPHRCMLLVLGRHGK